jgi:hypothetical protein
MIVTIFMGTSLAATRKRSDADGDGGFAAFT